MSCGGDSDGDGGGDGDRDGGGDGGGGREVRVNHLAQNAEDVMKK